MANDWKDKTLKKMTEDLRNNECSLHEWNDGKRYSRMRRFVDDTMRESIKDYRKRYKNTVLSWEIVETWCEYTLLGKPDSKFAAHAGLDPKLIRKWRRWGAEGKAPFKKILQLLAEVSLHHEMEVYEKMAKAGEDDWKMWSFILERRYSDTWAKKTQTNVEHTAPSDFTINVQAIPSNYKMPLDEKALLEEEGYDMSLVDTEPIDTYAVDDGDDDGDAVE